MVMDKMRALNKIILFGIVLISLIFTSSSFPYFKDTYASFIDTKYVNANFTTGTWDQEASLAGLSYFEIPENITKLLGINQSIKENSNTVVADNNFSDGNSSNNGSSADNSMNNSSAPIYATFSLTSDNQTAGNLTNNSNSDSGKGMGRSSSGSIDPEQSPAGYPVSNFSNNITSGYAPLSVQFKDLSENATEWSWDFGDGNTSTDRNSVYTYFSAGNYNVILTVTNLNGTNSKLATITVLEKPAVMIPPVANFSSNVTSGFVPFTMQFTDLSENATQWKWDFGDGSTSTEQSPVHTYSAVGNYRVNLTVSNENGTNSTFALITVLENTAPILPTANFSTNINIGFTPLSVQFMDLSENATSWYWDFGDETNSTDQHSAHIYFAAGNYIVSMTASNENGTDSKLAVINVLKQPVVVFPVANFRSNVTSGYVPLTVQFTSLSNNTAGWNWDFGDGNTSIDRNPAHIYSVAGNYTVNLAVDNANGTDSKLAIIKVLEQPVAMLPVSNFSSNVTSGYVPLSVQFTDLSKNATKWNWDFGNGNISTEQNPVYIYYTAGNYTVTLKTSNNNGQHTKTSQIYVNKSSDNLEDVNSSIYP